MHIFSILSALRIQDILDILFLTIIAYHLYIWFRGTKAFKALIGLALLGLIYTIARSWGLFLTTWFFQILWQVLVILLIILFQNEIRNALERFNPLRRLYVKRLLSHREWMSSFVEGILTLSKRQIGALIIVERWDRVDEFLTGCQEMEAEPTLEILLCIFQKESPIHDGAVLLRDGRIQKVACYLPLSTSSDIPVSLGTRHRAALGLSERTDAWVFVVSEENGNISLAREKELLRVDSAKRIRDLLSEATTLKRPKEGGPLRELLNIALRRWKIKVITLLGVLLTWLIFAGQQDFERELLIPLQLKNIPSGLELQSPKNASIKIKVRGLRKDVSTLRPEEISAWIDLKDAHFGENRFKLDPSKIVIPNEKIDIVSIIPSELLLSLSNKKRPQ